MSRKQPFFDGLRADPEQSPEVRTCAAYVGAWLRRIGRAGGQARAQRHTHEEFAAWGRMRHAKKAASAPHNDRESGRAITCPLDAAEAPRRRFPRL